MRARGFLSSRAISLQRGDDGLVAAQDEQLLRRVAPPAVGMVEVGDELRRRLVEHVRLRAGLEVLVDQPPDAAAADVLVHAVLLDDLAQVAALADPVPFLDDAAVHVDDVEAAVGAGGHVDRAEVGVGGADEFRLVVGVAEVGHALVVLDLGAADEPADRFAEQQVAAQVAGSRSPRKIAWPQVAVKWLSVLSSGRKRLVPALHVGQPDQRPDLEEVGRGLAGHVDAAVDDRRLEVQRARLAAAVGEPHLAVVVLGQAPLPAVAGRLFLHDVLAGVSGGGTALTAW